MSTQHDYPSFLYRIETTRHHQHHSDHHSFIVEAPNESEARGIAYAERMAPDHTINRVTLFAVVNLGANLHDAHVQLYRARLVRFQASLNP